MHVKSKNFFLMTVMTSSLLLITGYGFSDSRDAVLAAHSSQPSDTVVNEQHPLQDTSTHGASQVSTDTTSSSATPSLNTPNTPNVSQTSTDQGKKSPYQPDWMNDPDGFAIMPHFIDPFGTNTLNPQDQKLYISWAEHLKAILLGKEPAIHGVTEWRDDHRIRIDHFGTADLYLMQMPSDTYMNYLLSHPNEYTYILGEEWNKRLLKAYKNSINNIPFEPKINIIGNYFLSKEFNIPRLNKEVSPKRPISFAIGTFEIYGSSIHNQDNVLPPIGEINARYAKASDFTGSFMLLSAGACIFAQKCGVYDRAVTAASVTSSAYFDIEASDHHEGSSTKTNVNEDFEALVQQSWKTTDAGVVVYDVCSDADVSHHVRSCGRAVVLVHDPRMNLDIASFLIAESVPFIMGDVQPDVPSNISSVFWAHVHNKASYGKNRY